MIAIVSAMRRIVPVLVLAAAFWWCFAPQVLGRMVLYHGDLALYFIPHLDVQAEALRHGRIPLWNPWLLCGLPWVGNPQAWPLHPSSWLTAGWSGERAAGLISVAQSLIGALGMLAFLRRRGRGPAAGLLGALVFGFGGALVSKFQFPNMAQAMAWLPWMLVALEGVLDDPGPGTSARWGTSVGVGILCAHPQATYLQALLLAAWLLRRRPSRRARIWLLVGGAAGVAVAGAWLLPTIEVARASVRPSLSIARANRFVLPWEEVATAWVAPWFHGSPWGAPARPFNGNAWEPCAFVGWTAAMCAVGAVLFGRRDPDTRFWAGAWLVATWLALGRGAGLYEIAYRVLPGLSTFHDPARFLHLAGFAAGCLAAAGAEGAWRVRVGFRIPAAVWVVLAAAEILPFARGFHPLVPATVVARAKETLDRDLPRGGRLWFVDDEAAWRWFVDPRGYLPVSGDARAVEFMTSGMPNLPMWVRRRDAGGYEPVRPAVADARWRRMRIGRRPGAPVVPGAGDIGAFGVGALGFRDPARAATGWTMAPAPAMGARRVVADGNDVSLPTIPFGAAGSRVELDGLAGWVRITETATPGWRARVDGRPVPWREVDGFREARVPAGGRELVWEYDPTAWRIGLFVTFLGTCILGTLSGWARFRRKDARLRWPS